MKNIPIIFSAPMVQALLSGKKTMTRRLAWRVAPDLALKASPWQTVQPGDRLWVRETYGLVTNDHQKLSARWPVGTPLYRADHGIDIGGIIPDTMRWTPAIHILRKYSRLTLVVTATKIERLQDISDYDAMIEGAEVGYRPLNTGRTEDLINPPLTCSYQFGFEDLWKRLHGEESWDANPEVVALTFTVHKTNIDQLGKEAA